MNWNVVAKKWKTCIGIQKIYNLTNPNLDDSSEWKTWKLE